LDLYVNLGIFRHPGLDLVDPQLDINVVNTVNIVSSPVLAVFELSHSREETKALNPEHRVLADRVGTHPLIMAKEK
jgi:hypothetical protein